MENNKDLTFVTGFLAVQQHVFGIGFALSAFCPSAAVSILVDASLTRSWIIVNRNVEEKIMYKE